MFLQVSGCVCMSFSESLAPICPITSRAGSRSGGRRPWKSSNSELVAWDFELFFWIAKVSNQKSNNEPKQDLDCQSKKVMNCPHVRLDCQRSSTCRAISAVKGLGARFFGHDADPTQQVGIGVAAACGQGCSGVLSSPTDLNLKNHRDESWPHSLLFLFSRGFSYNCNHFCHPPRTDPTSNLLYISPTA